MKNLMVFFVILFFSQSANAVITTTSLSYLEGQTIVPYDGLNQDDALARFWMDTGFDVGETGFQQLELFLDFDYISLENKSELILLMENDYFIWFGINPKSQSARAISYYGRGPVSLENMAGVDVGSDLSFSVMFNHWLDDGFQYAPTDMITFGSESYIRITDEEEGLYPHPIPETGTFALFLLGAVGLCVRRQMKQVS